jgi:hypothetical protein
MLGGGGAREAMRDLAFRWFAIDSRSLALFRTGTAAVILWDLVAWRFPDLHTFYADQGMYPISVVRKAAAPWHWSVHELSGSPQYQAALFGLAIFFAVLLLVGYWTRFSAAVSWFLAVSLANRNPMVCNYGDTVLQLMLFWAAWIPCGETWSLDAWRRAGQARPVLPRPAICSVATACVLLQLSIFYFFSGLWKLNEDWFSGAATGQALLLDYATRPAADVLRQYPPLLQWATWATLGLELLGPWLVWIPWRMAAVRMIMIAAFVALHVGIEICLTPLLLSYICIVAWMLFLPGCFWELSGVRRIAQSWDRWLHERAAALGTAAGTAEPAAPGSRWWRVVTGACLSLLLAYVLVWNIATLSPGKLGFLMPRRAQWIAHVTLMRQQWDMFWIPARATGWFEARARLANDQSVDLLGNGRTLPLDPPRNNWHTMPNPRWKVFFRRLFEQPEPDAEVCRHVADYLWRRWNAKHAGEHRAVALQLVVIRNLPGIATGTTGILERLVVQIETADEDPMREFLRKLRSSDRGFWP